MLASGAVRILPTGTICRRTCTHVTTVRVVALMLRGMTLRRVCVRFLFMAISDSPVAARSNWRTHVSFAILHGRHRMAISVRIWMLSITRLGAWRCAVVVLGVFISGLALVRLHPLTGISRRSGGRCRRHRSSIDASVNGQGLSARCPIWHVLVAPIIRIALTAHPHYTRSARRRSGECVSAVDARTRSVWMWGD
jgi:hypothetical protein